MTRYYVEDISCGNCAQRIEDELNKNYPGKNFIVSLSSKTIVHQGSISKRDIEEVASRIEPIRLHDEAHHHAESESSVLPRFFLSLAMTLVAFFVLEGTLKIIVFMVAYLLIGYDVLLRSARNISRGQIFDENFLMSIATLGALVLGEYAEAVAVMLFYQLGEYFQDRAVDFSRKSIASVMELRVEEVMVLRDGSFMKASPEEIMVGEKLRLLPGEKVALDGIVSAGESSMDTASITGESLPRYVTGGTEILSGFVNRESEIIMEVTKPFSESTVSKILKLVEESAEHKAKTEQFITKFARYYTPAVVLLALLIALLPPLFTGDAFSTWIYRGLIFLVISCPCALVLSIPLSFFGGLGASSKHGIIVKGGEHLEALDEVKHLVLDKTGTITEGRFVVTEILPEEHSKKELLALAATIEQKSRHPIARSIVEAYGEVPEATDSITEHSGKGLQMGSLLAGNRGLMEAFKVSVPDFKSVGTDVLLAQDGIYLGRIVLEDQVKENTKQVLDDFRAEGIKTITMLTGDSKEAAEKVSQKVGVDRSYSSLLPQDKVAKVKEIMASHPGERLAFVGDGTNDAPVIALSDVGVAMGAMGTDAAIEASDLLLMKDDLGSLVTGKRIARFTKRIVWQNIILALGTKLVVLILGILGVSSMWMAVFADVGVAILAVLNTLRILYRSY